MHQDPALDALYYLNPRVVATVKSPQSMTISGAGPVTELSFDLFQVLMAFAERNTARQAFYALDTDVDLDEFGSVIREFFDRGFLRQVHPVDDRRNLRHLLNPRIFSEPALVCEIGRWMRQGRAIVIPDALPGEFAERVHQELDSSLQWTVAEGSHDFFHYRNCSMEGLESRSQALADCNLVFSCPATRDFIGEMSGQDCRGEVGVAAAWYRPGEYALPHNDSRTDLPRSVAYIWYLAKNWRQNWGGALYWCPSGQYILPRFNSLLMFNITPASYHFVCPVAPIATEKRLSINGFWHGIEGRPTPSPISSDAVISPTAYGHPAPEISELSPIVVL